MSVPTSDYEFWRWMQRVDAELVSRYGAPSDDLPDQSYRDYFDSGMSPEEAVDEISEELE